MYKLSNVDSLHLIFTTQLNKKLQTIQTIWILYVGMFDTTNICWYVKFSDFKLWSRQKLHKSTTEKRLKNNVKASRYDDMTWLPFDVGESWRWFDNITRSLWPAACRG